VCATGTTLTWRASIPYIDKPKESHEIMQLEGTAAGATALFEMLVHTHGGVTKVFPATPEAWREASFRGVPQPGGFEISATRSAGATETIEVPSLRGGRIVLDAPDRGSMTMHRAGRAHLVSFPVELPMDAGETVSFRAS
jgi:hypothetical protein